MFPDGYYEVLAQGGASHRCGTERDARDLAESLRRWGWVEIVRHYEDEEGHGWKVVARLDPSREKV